MTSHISTVSAINYFYIDAKPYFKGFLSLVLTWKSQKIHTISTFFSENL